MNARPPLKREREIRDIVESLGLTMLQATYNKRKHIKVELRTPCGVDFHVHTAGTPTMSRWRNNFKRLVKEQMLKMTGVIQR
jgi:hypothetical protein